MAHLLTLQDIAQLAGVTRQAVTNWRRRNTVRGEFLPFPVATVTRGGLDFFDREQILDWLETTRRGRNLESRIEAPSLSVPDAVTLDDAVTMLALRSAYGDDLGQRSGPELIALAEEIDPDDRFLLVEVRAISEDRALASYVDELVEGSYGPTDALSRLYATRLARWGAKRGLTDELLGLLKAIAGACGEHLGMGDVAIELRIDPRARAIASGFAGVRAGDGPEGRAIVRHLLIEGVDRVDATWPLVRVISAVGHSDREVLELVDTVALELGPNDIAVLLGPGSALCDPLRGQMARARSQTVEMGRLVAAFRLPRGMWREAHRQSVAIWILRGGVDADRLVVADLTSESIDVGDLVSDIVAALEQSSARAFRYGRSILQQEARGRSSVVASGIRAVQLIGSGLPGARDRVNEATLVTRDDLTGFDVLVTRAPAAIVTTPRSLGEMVESRRIELLNGCRLDAADAEPTGTIGVLSADPASECLQIDPLVAERRYPHARRTQPGDVVFTDRPRPAAIVDQVGGSIIMVGSRGLRLPQGVGIGPRALAEVINQLPDDAGEWRTWSIPHLADDQIELVEETLASAVAHLAELRRRESATHDIIANLIQGVATGGIAISPSTTKKAG